MPTIDQLKENLPDIQGNILRGYGPHFATYRFYHISDPKQGRNWLKELLHRNIENFHEPQITTSEYLSTGQKPSFTINLAYSFRGLSSLGVNKDLLNTFPEEFQEGMYKRAVPILGDEPKAKGADVNEKDMPKHWTDQFLQKSEADQIHILVLVTAGTEELKEKGVACLEKAVAKFDGVKFLFALEGKRRPDSNSKKEHFGFTDGISQPFLEGTEEVLGNKNSYPGHGTPDTSGKWKSLKPGEFILGYEDEFGEVAQNPSHYDLRKNGTYLVLRVLEEDVQAFKQFLKATAEKLWPSEYHKDCERHETMLAAKFIGRWPSGCPVIRSEEKDDASIGENPHENNNFLYIKNDPDGQKCPLGAHIRRVNPRDHLLLTPKDIYDDTENYDYHLNRHRIIRRGLPYGEEFQEGGKDAGDRGVIFLALNASIKRQFEFLQSQWMNSGEFLGLEKTDRDPFMGKTGEKGAKFTVPGAENPFAVNLQRFVTERGGEYFFYPGLTALQKLADGVFGADPSSMSHVSPRLFLAEYRALESISHPFKRAVAKQRLVSDWLINHAKAMFDELRDKKPIFIVPPVVPPKNLPDYKKPPMVIATKYDDVLEILRNEDKNFSVALYREKMAPPRGPFVLGMEYHQDQYKKELSIIKAAVYPQSGDVRQTLYAVIDRLAGEIIGKIKEKGEIDVIGDLVWPVALRLNGEFFGVPGPGRDSDLEIFKRWCRDIYTDLFLNLRGDLDWERLADKAVTEMNHYLKNLIEVRRKELKNSKKEPETVLDRLIRIQEEPGEKFEDGWEGVRRNIFGMVTAVVETTLKAVPRTIDQLLKRAEILSKAREAALEYSHSQDPKKFTKYVFEAMRFNPQNHVLFRLAQKPFKLAVETNRETDCPGPALVFAGTLGAMFDPEKVKDPEPEEFSIDRPDDNYLFFGYEHHKCLGEQISRIQIPLLVKHVVTLNNLRRHKNGDQFDTVDLLPEHFLLDFDVTKSDPNKKKTVVIVKETRAQKENYVLD